MTALAVRDHLTPRGVYEQRLHELRQTLMDDDCYLPFARREVPELTKNAALECASPDAENLRNGLDRPIDGEERFKALGLVEEKLFTAVCVWRGDLPRFISVRRSNTGEERAYRSAG